MSAVVVRAAKLHRQTGRRYVEGVKAVLKGSESRGAEALVQKTLANVNANGGLPRPAIQNERPVRSSVAVVDIFAKLLHKRPDSSLSKAKALVPPSKLKLDINQVGGLDKVGGHQLGWHVVEIRAEGGASLDAMIGVRGVDRVVEGEVIEHGLLAPLDDFEVGIDGPISRARTGNGASFGTEVDSPWSCADRRGECGGPWDEATSPKCHREP